ncbi:MAG: hypothetical protein RIF32_22330 [Leptospirales bacterium]
MRFSKPTTEGGRVRRFPFRFSRSAPGLVFAAGLLLATCYSPPAILVRRYDPPERHLRHAGFEIQIAFLDAARLLDRARWLNGGARALSETGSLTAEPPFAAARRAPNLTAIEIVIYNYGDSPAGVDFSRFRIQDRSGQAPAPTPSDPKRATETKTGAAPPGTERDRPESATQVLRPLSSAEFQRDHASIAIGALSAYEFAFAPREIHRFAWPLPDWYAKRRAAHEDTRSVAEGQRSEGLRELDHAAQRQRLAPGGEIRGIALFRALAENQTYELRYEASTGTDFSMPALSFEFRTEARRSARWLVFSYIPDAEETAAPGDSAEKNDAMNSEDPETRRETEFRAARDYRRMHEQLRAHDRIRAGLREGPRQK